MQDAIKQASLGELGISPGWRIPPPDVTGTQRIVQDVGESVLTRELLDVRLDHVALVSRAAYAGSTVELRTEEFENGKSSSISEWEHFLYLL